ncbi:DNA-binding transcriptional regulator, MarR family [Rhodospirillales bacterium URHD0017]|nr:DNA-binding transcriptional regulator, MarR family [Rhodospirillales bacterium URHD0017]
MTKAKIPVPERHRVPAHLARRFHQVCLGITAEVTERAGLTPVEWAVIAALEEVPDIEQAALATRLGIDPVTAHHVVNRLAAAGYVERRISPTDRRARALRLTRRGQALRDHLRADGIASQKRILAPLTRQEARTFLELLRRLVEAHEPYARPGNGRRRPPAPATTTDQRRTP